MRARLLLVLATCMGGFGALAAWVVRVGGHVGIDRHIAVAVANHRTASVTTVMSASTRLGSGPAAGLVLVVLAAVAVWRRDAGLFLTVGAAVAAATITSQTLKRVVDRPRPGDAFALRHLGTASFPSGHATMAAALWGSLALATWARGRTPLGPGALLGGWALVVSVVAISRVELGVHWATDVVAGALLGTACVAGTAVLLGVADWREGPNETGPTDGAERRTPQRQFPVGLGMGAHGGWSARGPHTRAAITRWSCWCTMTTSSSIGPSRMQSRKRLLRNSARRRSSGRSPFTS